MLKKEWRTNKPRMSEWVSEREDKYKSHIDFFIAHKHIEKNSIKQWANKTTTTKKCEDWHSWK